MLAGHCDPAMHRITQIIAAGLSDKGAAWVVGVHHSLLRLYAEMVPDVAGRLAAARAARPSSWAATWPVPRDDVLELLAALADGFDLTRACEAANLPLPTVKQWRRRFSMIDALIVAAAGDDRHPPLRPYPRLTCPGDHCGSKTGYDYGCKRPPCRSAAVEPVTDARRTKGTR
ncbi:hypothetical protein [Nonomuraea salmonea]